MKRIILTLLFVTIAMTTSAEEVSYEIRQDDTLAGILRALGYGESYAELLPLIKRTIEMNPSVFPDGSANLLYPGTVVSLPPNPNLPEPVPEPQPEPMPEPELMPEPMPEPVPEPEPEPVIPVIGSLQVRAGLSEIQRPGDSVEVSARADIYANDLVTTRDSTLAEIILLDDTRISLGPNSEVIVTEYSYTLIEGDDATALGSLVASIRNGAVRMLTGLIGKSPSNRFEISSSLTATIGIRGTDFTVRTCNDRENCGDYFGVAVAVKDGKVSFKNQGAEIELNENEFAQIQSATEVAEKRPVPEGFFDLQRDVSEIESPNSWWQNSIDYLESLF